MGTFDWVTDNGKPFEMDCPACGTKMNNGFQSKELNRVLAGIDWKNFSYFYNSCQACKAWIDCYVETDHNTLKVYAVADENKEGRKLTREEPWTLQGRTAEEWADTIRDKGADGVRELLRAQLIGRGLISEEE